MAKSSKYLSIGPQVQIICLEIKNFEPFEIINFRCDAAGVTVEQVEDFFCRNFRKKNKKENLGKERPNHFYSKVYIYSDFSSIGIKRE